ncbi:MAG: diguanylate cyclase [Actinomycetota bacterium]|nr:diguanylate cyclase [Actinomycetota bacterium]
MRIDAVADPEGCGNARPPASADVTAAAFARAFFSHPSRVAVGVEVMAAIAVASVLPLRHWPSSSLAALVTALALALGVAGLRAVIGARLSDWSLQVDVGLANLFVSVVAAAAASAHVDLANLYLLVEIFALLYLPLRWAIGQLAFAGAAYAVVLAVGPRTATPPVVAWLSVFGTGAVIGAVVLGLVHALRSTARTDPLTGLANRRLWDERLEEEMERSARSGTALSVVMVDLDDFKAVNRLYATRRGERPLIRAVGRVSHWTPEWSNSRRR